MAPNVPTLVASCEPAGRDFTTLPAASRQVLSVTALPTVPVLGSTGQTTVPATFYAPAHEHRHRLKVGNACKPARRFAARAEPVEYRQISPARQFPAGPPCAGLRCCRKFILDRRQCHSYLAPIWHLFRAFLTKRAGAMQPHQSSKARTARVVTTHRATRLGSGG